MMKTNTIIRKKKSINAKIDKLEKELVDLQNQCTHEHMVYQYGGDTGNWCRSDDSYWIDWYCPVCELRINTTQDYGVEKSMLKQYSKATRLKYGEKINYSPL